MSSHHPYPHLIRHCSIVTPIDFDSASNDNFHDPLINSAVVTPNCTNDEEIARQHQEQLYAQSISNSYLPPIPSSIDMRPLEDLEADEALARRLQEEEYTRKNIAPNRSYSSRGSSNNPTTAPKSTVHRSGIIQTDAELAAQLQEEENKKQRQQRLAAPIIPRPNSTNNGSTLPERIPIPPLNRNRQQPTRTMSNINDEDDHDDNQASARPTRNRPNHTSSHRNNNSNNIRPQDTFSLFQPFLAGANRGGLQRLEQTPDDFGPDDYEHLLELDKSVDKRPLTADQINRLPTEKFRRTATKTAEEITCNICWDEFENNQTIRRLPCLHMYHKDCIDKWLKTNDTCPICRISANQ